MVEHDTDDVAAHGAIPLDVIQKYLNFHYSVSLDLFGGETSTNVAQLLHRRAQGPLAGGPPQGRPPAHRRRDPCRRGRRRRRSAQTEVSALVGLNTDLRREYIADCQGGVKRWNQILDEAGLAAAARAAARRVQPQGRRVRRHRGHARTASCSTADEWDRAQGRWLPTDVDKTHVRSLMQPVHERGKIAAWIAPPRNGINGKPFDYDYVHLA